MKYILFIFSFCLYFTIFVIYLLINGLFKVKEIEAKTFAEHHIANKSTGWYER